MMRQDENDKNTLEKEDNSCREAIEELLGLASDYQLRMIYRIISNMVGHKE